MVFFHENASESSNTVQKGVAERSGSSSHSMMYKIMMFLFAFKNTKSF